MLVIVPAFNAGDTTRGIEAAKAFHSAAARHGRTTEIEFLYPTSSTMYDGAIRAAGFAGRALDAGFSDALVQSVMTADHDGTEFLTDLDQAGDLLDRILEELRAAKPDLVLYGFLPPVGVAAQILGIPSACYSPFPADREWVTHHFLTTIPDEFGRGPLGRLPSHA